MFGELDMPRSPIFIDMDKLSPRYIPKVFEGMVVVAGEVELVVLQAVVVSEVAV